MSRKWSLFLDREKVSFPQPNSMGAWLHSVAPEKKRTQHLWRGNVAKEGFVRKGDDDWLGHSTVVNCESFLSQRFWGRIIYDPTFVGFSFQRTKQNRYLNHCPFRLGSHSGYSKRTPRRNPYRGWCLYWQTAGLMSVGLGFLSAPVSPAVSKEEEFLRKLERSLWVAYGVLYLPHCWMIWSVVLLDNRFAVQVSLLS